MRTVGIKQLKARLSEYVRAVRNGEVFLVTDRDEVVAELRPPGSAVVAPPLDFDTAAVLADLESSGDVVAARAPKAGWEWKPAGARLEPGAATRILEELRRDRFDG